MVSGGREPCTGLAGESGSGALVRLPLRCQPGLQLSATWLGLEDWFQAHSYGCWWQASPHHHRGLSVQLLMTRLPPEWVIQETGAQDQSHSLLQPNFRSNIPSILPHSTDRTGCEYQGAGIIAGHPRGCLPPVQKTSFSRNHASDSCLFRKSKDGLLIKLIMAYHTLKIMFISLFKSINIMIFK